jgi:hypothetical protein
MTRTTYTGEDTTMMKARKTRQFAVVTWKNVYDPATNMLALGTMATCGHDDDACPRITADVLIREGSVSDAAQAHEHWDGEAVLLDPIVCYCAR